ncbi:prohead protease [Pseudoalteromonas phage AL]|nr:gene transfer agent prohead protease [Pseudoalteromonas phage SL25]QIG62448.1 prohead protease [Pseudoalteromonas phage AL]WMM36578.1 gene transfer agent prohead protease [Pseudoalteromonas phage PS_L5]
MELKALQFKEQDVNVESRTFKGYASTWDKDNGSDIITKGAFSKTLGERSDRIKILWQHDAPLGKPTLMREDEKGLYVEGYISKTRLGDEALELMRDGVVDQMSIGFSIPQGKSEYSKNDSARVIREVKLYEFSPVTFPMNDNAMITGVKSLREQIMSGGNMSDTQIKELSSLLDEMKALIAGEAASSTSHGKQPQDLKALQDAILNFGL